MLAKNILTTTGNRIFIAVLALVVLGLNARYLGMEALGTISLLILALTINLMLSNIFCGSAVVYLASRKSPLQLIWIGLTGALISTTAGTFIQAKLHVFPVAWSTDVWILSMLLALSGLLQNLLVSREKLSLYNLSALWQQISLTAVLAYEILVNRHTSPAVYLYALYLSWISTLVLLIFFNRNLPKRHFTPWKELLNLVLRYGLVIQVTNLVQTVNYRLVYLFIEHYFNRRTLGFFSAGLQLAEGLWIIGRSLALVTYSRLSNVSDEVYARKLTLLLTRFCAVVSLSGVATLLLIPSSWYAAYLGSDFSDIKSVFPWLGPGVILFNMAMLSSHYFASRALYRTNLLASLTGLLVMAGSGLLLIPSGGEQGAALATTLSHTANALFLLIAFMRHTGSPFHEILPSRSDGTRLLQLLGSIRVKK